MAILHYTPRLTLYCLDLFYGYIFSFNEILDSLETGQVIIAALLGIDCQEQLNHHMIGMMFNGARREEIEALRSIVLVLAERLGVKFKKTPIPVTEMPERRAMVQNQ